MVTEERRNIQTTADKKKRSLKENNEDFYTLALINDQLAPEIQALIKNSVQKKLGPKKLLIPKKSEHLSYVKNYKFKVLIIDENIASLDEVMNIALYLKKKMFNEGAPILFLTKDPDKLIAKYKEVLLPFTEQDEFFHIGEEDLEVLASRITNFLDTSLLRRRSLRIPLDIMAGFRTVNQLEYTPIKILNISLHGALILFFENKTIKAGTQVLIQMPVSGLLPAKFGEILRLSAKIRRVKIDGQHAGVSWENSSEEQFIKLTKFILSCSRRNLEFGS